MSAAVSSFVVYSIDKLESLEPYVVASTALTAATITGIEELSSLIEIPAFESSAPLPRRNNSSNHEQPSWVSSGSSGSASASSARTENGDAPIRRLRPNGGAGATLVRLRPQVLSSATTTNANNTTSSSTATVQRRPGVSDADWSELRNFKTTKMEVIEGIDKQINEIRVLINKLTPTTYNKIKVAILEKVEEFFNSEDAIMRISAAIVEIASSNKFYSEIYSNLYVELINKQHVFADHLETITVSLMESINEIHYSDPSASSESYNKYCEYVKSNDKRRALSNFLVCLHLAGVITSERIKEVADAFFSKIMAYIDVAERTNETEEITENVFLLLGPLSMQVANQELWMDVAGQIEHIVGMKVKEHAGFTSRALFKYMDLAKLIKDKRLDSK